MWSCVSLSDPGSTERTAQKRKFPSPPHSSNGHSPQDTSTSPIKKKKKPGLLNNNNKEQVKGRWEWRPHQQDKGCSEQHCSFPGVADSPCSWHLASCLALAVICIGQEGQLKMGLCRNFQWLFKICFGDRAVTQMSLKILCCRIWGFSVDFLLTLYCCFPMWLEEFFLLGHASRIVLSSAWRWLRG